MNDKMCGGKCNLMLYIYIYIHIYHSKKLRKFLYQRCRHLIQYPLTMYLQWNCTSKVKTVTVRNWNCTSKVKTATVRNWNCTSKVKTVTVRNWNCTSKVKTVTVRNWNCTSTTVPVRHVCMGEPSSVVWHAYTHVR